MTSSPEADRMGRPTGGGAANPHAHPRAAAGRPRRPGDRRPAGYRRRHRRRVRGRRGRHRTQLPGRPRRGRGGGGRDRPAGPPRAAAAGRRVRGGTGRRDDGGSGAGAGPAGRAGEQRRYLSPRADAGDDGGGVGRGAGREPEGHVLLHPGRGADHGRPWHAGRRHQPGVPRRRRFGARRALLGPARAASSRSPAPWRWSWRRIASG